MIKKILSVVVIATLTFTLTPAEAKLKSSTSVPTLAILDTALDTSIPEISSRLVAEVCILDWPSCPNGKTFMEGAGATVLPKNIISNRNFNHGTQMASVAIQNNPNMNIVFVRIIGHTSTGNRQITKANTVPNALNWVIQNKEKYNIQAVAMSQGHHNLGRTADYCPKNAAMDAALLKLSSLDVPAFFANGNDRDYNRIDWPACSSAANVIAVGGAESYGSPSTYSNHDPVRTDFFEVGSAKVIFPGGGYGYAAGSSVSTQALAAKWLMVKSYKTSYNTAQIYELIKNTSTQVKNSRNVLGSLVDIAKALNG